MKVSGPHLNKSRRQSKRRWYLSYFEPKSNDQGQPVLDLEGRPVIVRRRPHYETRAAAEADRPRIVAQVSSAGNAGGAVFTRDQVADIQAARQVEPFASFLSLARFWKRHNPDQAAARVNQLRIAFLVDAERRKPSRYHLSDLTSHTAKLSKVFGERAPGSIEKREIIDWVFSLSGAARTQTNYFNSVLNFFGWMHDCGDIPENPLADMDRRNLPRVVSKEVRFLPLANVVRYLRACERYDPEIVAHEVVQLFSGVRSDDEMSDFRGEWVLPQTGEIVIPAEIAKTERREVIGELEPNFWKWWKVYGRSGVLRPVNYTRRWKRIRYLATIEDLETADAAAGLTLPGLDRLPDRIQRLGEWPWNGRRRSFCTYHVAKHQSAAKTALILRHRGSPYTLHESYRGTGVTQQEGAAYFETLPKKVQRQVLLVRSARKSRTKSG